MKRSVLLTVESEPVTQQLGETMDQVPPRKEMPNITVLYK